MDPAKIHAAIAKALISIRDEAKLKSEIASGELSLFIDDHENHVARYSIDQMTAYGDTREKYGESQGAIWAMTRVLEEVDGLFPD